MLSNKLKQLRNERSLTQEDICRVLNVSKNCYASYEQGRTEPNISMLIKLADIFSVSVDELVDRKPEHHQIDVRKELRLSTLKLVDATEKLNDMGIAVVLGYVARLIEDNPEFLLPSARLG